MLRVALREIRAHLGRSLMAVIAVVLGIAFVTGTFSLRAMLAGTIDNLMSSVEQADLYVRGTEVDTSSAGQAPADAQVPEGAQPPADGQVPADAQLPDGTQLPPDAQVPADTQPPAGDGADGSALMALATPRAPVDTALADPIEQVEGVDHAVPEMAGMLVLVGADGLAVVNGNAPGIGWGWGWDEGNTSMTIAEGRAPREPGEIAVESTALERSGLSIGDTTTIVAGGSEPREVGVVGRVDSEASLIGATVVMLDRTTAEEVYAPGGTVRQIAVYAPDGATTEEIDALADDVRAALGGTSDVEVVTGDDVREANSEAMEEAVGFLGTFLLVFAIIALFVGGFIIFNTFAMQVRQKQRDYALLRAIGAAPAQVLAALLGQAAVIGLLGSVVGVAVGVGMVAAVGRFLTSLGMEFSTQVLPSTGQIVGTLVLGTLTTVIAAAVPARRGSLTAPVEAMRDAAAPPERPLVGEVVLGAVLTVFGAVALWQAIAQESGWWLAGAAAGLLLGVLTLSPAIARVALPVLAAPAVVALRPMGRLARGNVVRHPRRTAVTAGALMIGMALVGACAVLADSATESTSAVVDQETSADLWVQSASGTVPPGVVPALQDLDAVQRADIVNFGMGTTADDDRVSLASVPDGALGTTLDVPVIEGDLGALDATHVALQRSSDDGVDWGVGGTVDMVGPDGPVSLEIVAIVDSTLLGGDLVVLPETLDTLVAPEQVRPFAILLQGDGLAPEQLKDEVTPVLQPYVVLTAMTSEEMVSSVSQMVDQAMVILYALLAMSVVIAILGIVNTLALSVVERTREIGLMRAVGLGRSQLAGTLVLESILTAVLGTVLGLAVGVGLGAALPQILQDEGLSVLSIPWDLLAGFVAVSVLVGVLAAVLPAWRAVRLPVLEAVASD